MQAGALNCPNCGAAVTADAPQCPYCHALLQTTACSRCHGMMFQGAKFCSHCGAPAHAISVGATAAQACPICRTSLLNIQIARFPAQECTICGGLWIDPASFDQVRRLGSPVRRAGLGSSADADGLLRPAPAYLPCPSCAQLMSRVNFAHRSGVVTSVCRPHGVWLERDQLRQIVEFIRAGGLQRARQLEQEQIAADRRRLESDRAAGQGPLGRLSDALDSAGDDDDDSPLSYF